MFNIFVLLFFHRNLFLVVFHFGSSEGWKKNCHFLNVFFQYGGKVWNLQFSYFIAFGVTNCLILWSILNSLLTHFGIDFLPGKHIHMVLYIEYDKCLTVKITKSVNDGVVLFFLSIPNIRIDKISLCVFASFTSKFHQFSRKAIS